MHWILEVIADTKREAASVLTKEEDISQPSDDSCPSSAHTSLPKRQAEEKSQHGPHLTYQPVVLFTFKVHVWATTGFFKPVSSNHRWQDPLPFLNSAIWLSVSFTFQEHSSLSNFLPTFPLIYF